MPARTAQELTGRPAILLADDNPDIRWTQQMILESCGYNVHSRANAREAETTFAEKGNIGLLITDIEMPGRSGLELADSLTSKEPGLPVLIVSGVLLSEEQEARISSRHWTFMAKPVNVAKMLNVATSMIVET